MSTTCPVAWCITDHPTDGTFHEGAPAEIQKTTGDPIEIVLSHDTDTDPEVLIELRLPELILLTATQAELLAGTIRARDCCTNR